MQRKKAQLSYLKQGEALGGGRVAVYLSNLLVRMDDHTKLKETEGFGIKGTLVDLTLLKSRTSAAGNSITLVFDYTKGFDQELSLFFILKDQGLVNGAGAYLYIGDRSDIKFSQKQFKQKLQDNAELQTVFMEYALIALNNIINDQGEPESYVTPNFDITSSILNKMMEVAA